MRNCATGVLIILLLIIPNFAWALCTSTGSTVIYVNGVFGTLVDAQNDLFKLETKFFENGGSRDVQFRNGYNPSHLAGGGDLLQSLFQAFNSSVSDYDLNTILMQIQPEVTTRKILLLGHSQGSFYTDEMYGYLVGHGVPKESIAVYNVGTPESFVAGGGGYLTSTNDKVINAVRDTENAGNLQVYLNTYYVHTSNVVNSALRANITLPKETGWDTDLHGGHYFSNAYLNNAADRIVHDISGELGALKAGSVTDSPSGCFTPPPPTLGYKAQTALLAASDSLVGGASSAGMVVENGALALAQGTFGAFAFGATTIQHAVGLGSNAGQVSAAALPFDQLQIPASVSQSSEPSADVPAQPQESTSVQDDVAPPPPPPQPTTPPAPEVALVAQTYSPGFGGGGGGANPTPQPQQESQQNQDSDDSQQDQDAPSNPPDGTPSDTTPPDAPVISVPACAASLLAGSCLVATTTVDVAWNAATDAAYYAVAKNGIVGATTTALSSPVILSVGATNSLAVVAYDAAGNAATSSARDVAATMQPLIINEIAWGGRGDSQAGGGIQPDDQAIELKNTSPYSLDLSHIVLTRSGGPSIALSGTLSALEGQVYYVITAPSPALSTTTAEQLSLVWNASTTFDATPPVSTCPTWCAGAYLATIGTNVGGDTAHTAPISMERKSNSDGTLATSWQNTDGYGPWLGNGSGVSDSIGVANSAGLPDAGVYCGSNTNLLEQKAPPGPAFHPGSNCRFLSRFVTTQLNAATTNRFGGLFRGDVASSTGGGGPLFGPAYAVPVSIQDPQPGEHFFFAIWENRFFANDSTVFNFYLTQGASSTQGIAGPPHGNYVILPFTYAP